MPTNDHTAEAERRPHPDDGSTGLEALSFLLGAWEAAGSPPGERGGFQFARQLLGRVIVRTNYADYPATAARPAFRHEDLMVIFDDAEGGLRADYYDSEGHVIRYAVRCVGATEVVFACPPTTAAPGFRLIYRLDADGTLHGTFEVAPPDPAAPFAPYLAWSARRAGESLSTCGSSR